MSRFIDKFNEVSLILPKSPHELPVKTVVHKRPWALVCFGCFAILLLSFVVSAYSVMQGDHSPLLVMTSVTLLILTILAGLSFLHFITYTKTILVDYNEVYFEEKSLFVFEDWSESLYTYSGVELREVEVATHDTEPKQMVKYQAWLVHPDTLSEVLLFQSADKALVSQFIKSVSMLLELPIIDTVTRQKHHFEHISLNRIKTLKMIRQLLSSVDRQLLGNKVDLSPVREGVLLRYKHSRGGFTASTGLLLTGLLYIFVTLSTQSQSSLPLVILLSVFLVFLGFYIWQFLMSEEMVLETTCLSYQHRYPVFSLAKKTLFLNEITSVSVKKESHKPHWPSVVLIETRDESQSISFARKSSLEEKQTISQFIQNWQEASADVTYESDSEKSLNKRLG